MATADASSHPGQDHHDTPSLEHTFPKTAQAKLTFPAMLREVGERSGAEIHLVTGERSAAEIHLADRSRSLYLPPGS